MHRPRFVPNNDTLEPRALLATFNLFTPTSYNASGQALSTYQQRLQRIERLPNFLQTVSPGRPLDRDVVASIQHDLTSIISHLNPASRSGLYTYNKNLRTLLQSSSVSKGNIQPILTMFSKTLASTGMPTSTVNSLTQSVKSLARASINTVSNAPSVVANDTSLVLQLALAMGRPLPAPRTPHLAQADAIPGRTGYTYNTRPTLVGTYEPSMTVYVLSFQGNQILGKAATNSKGQYRVTLTTPLNIGLNRLKIVAVGPNGIGSLASTRFGIGVLAPRH